MLVRLHRKFSDLYDLSKSFECLNFVKYELVQEKASKYYESYYECETFGTFTLKCHLQ